MVGEVVGNSGPSTEHQEVGGSHQYWCVGCCCNKPTWPAEASYPIPFDRGQGAGFGAHYSTYGSCVTSWMVRGSPALIYPPEATEVTHQHLGLNVSVQGGQSNNTF